MKKFEAVIFDWNGTLIDDAWLSVKAMNKMLQKRGKKPITIDFYSKVFEFPVINYYKALDLDVENEWEEISQEFIDYYLEEMSAVKLFDDTQFFLNYLHENSIDRGILSAMKHEWLNGHVRKFGIDHFFSFIQGIEDHYGEGKSHLAKKIKTQLNTDPGKVLFIGDTVHDLEVSQTAGFKTILVPRGHNSIERLKETGTTVLNSFKEIISFIESDH